MSANDGLVVVFERNSFYRRQYLLALSAFGMTLLVIAVLLWMLSFLLKNPVHPLYFATDRVGRLIDVVPVTKPNMTIDDVIAWSIDATEAAYSYDFVNYRGQLQASQKYFTPYGWNKFMSALTASNNLVALKERKMVVTAQVVDKPKILAQGILAGAYAWKFRMPLLVTFWLPPYDDKSRFSNALDVTVIVQRQPILQSNRGLGIVQIIASAGTANSVQTPEMSDTPSG